MTASTIMSAEVTTVPPEMTLAEATLIMSRRQVHNLPVVDARGCFVGLLSLRRLTREMLPTAARMDADSFHLDIGFLSDEADEYLKRLCDLGQRPVSELLEDEKKLRFCAPDTPMPKLLQLLSENPTSLPVLVVEGQSRRIVGMVSNWDVLNRIAVDLMAKLVETSAENAAAQPACTEERK